MEFAIRAIVSLFSTKGTFLAIIGLPIYRVVYQEAVAGVLTPSPFFGMIEGMKEYTVIIHDFFIGFRLRSIAPILLVILFLNTSLALDSVVLFNEIMYHPADQESSQEWLELYNPLAVDMDLSDWSITGGIHYMFPEGAVLSAGAYLLLAIDPQWLQSETAHPKVYGPFQGRLGNGREPLCLVNNSGRIMDKVTYDDDGDWPVAADGSGVSLAKIDPLFASHSAESWTWSLQMGGTPGAKNFASGYADSMPLENNPITPNTNSCFIFNELCGASISPWWIELANSSHSDIQLQDYHLIRKGQTAYEYRFPEQSLAPGQFLLLDDSTLGFRALDGDKLFLVCPGQNRIVDALAVTSGSQARLNPEWGAWGYPEELSPGRSNPSFLNESIVINEIMYHPAMEGPGREWIELYNRTGQPVLLEGWQISGAVTFPFHNEQVIDPGHYLIIAKDAESLRKKHPEIDIVGNYQGKLSNAQENILLIDTNGNIADCVHYYDGGYWPKDADGYGASLELRHPGIDNTLPSAWRASREADRSHWQNYSYRGIAAPPPGSNNPTRWQEFIIGLLGPGEILIDDISVIRLPQGSRGSRTEQLQNGSFEMGVTSWRPLGNHGQCRVIPDPENPGNEVLHIIATGATGHMHNHVETTLKNGDKVMNGRVYEMSFRAKWLSGSNQLHTRLYFNRLAKTTLLQRPEGGGTPGRRNSRYEPVLGPNLRCLQHHPPVPAPGEPIDIRIEADDPYGIAKVTLFWSLDGAEYNTIPMPLCGRHCYKASLPGQAPGTVVQFYVQARDGLGTPENYPVKAKASRLLLQVDDGRAWSPSAHHLRIIMLPADAEFLHETTNVMSNHRQGATVVYNEKDVYYDVGVRIKGTGYGRRSARAGYNIRFHPDRLFQGVHDVIALDRNGGPGTIGASQRELVLKHIANRAGQLPSMYDDVVTMLSPLGHLDGPAQMMMARYDDAFLSGQYEDGTDGSLYEYELIYYSTKTDNNQPDGLKLPPNAVLGVDIRDMGPDKEAYRWNYLIKNKRIRDEYSRVIDMAQTFSLNSSELEEVIDQVIDVDQWMRVFAFESLTGVADTYNQGLAHNLMFYVRPSDQRVLAFPWDLDHAFYYPSNAPIFGKNSNLQKVIAIDRFKRQFLGHLHDIITRAFHVDYLSEWVHHYGLVTGLNRTNEILDYVDQRRQFVLDQLPAFVPFQLLTSRGRSYSVEADRVMVRGRGWINIRSIRLADTAAPPAIVWADLTTWECTLPLESGENSFTFQAYDYREQLLGEITLQLTHAVSN